MADAPKLIRILDSVGPLLRSGVSIHWLNPYNSIDQNGNKRGKTPVTSKWQSAPNRSEDDLKSAFRAGYNVGLRLGEPSKVGEYYLHLVDLDVRAPQFEAPAWAALLEIWPEARDFPYVISGSGGASRHIYFLTRNPLRKTKIAKSEGQFVEFSESLGRNITHFDWEIDLMGTGSQAVLPPSLHPDTHKPYVWGKEIDLSRLNDGIGPIVSDEKVESWGARASNKALEDDDDLETLFNNSPMDLDETRIDEILAQIPNDHVEIVNGEEIVVGAHYDDYIEVGMALHHQYQGGKEGYEKWVEWAEVSEKFRESHARYRWDRSFGSSSTPVRMATLIKKAAAFKLMSEHDFEIDGDDFDDYADHDDILDLSAAVDDDILDLDAADDEILDLDAADDEILDLDAAVGDDILDLDAADDEILDLDAADDILDLSVPVVQSRAVDATPPKLLEMPIPKKNSEWESLLHRSPEGELKSTSHNIGLIVKNDVRLFGVFGFNEFTQDHVILREPVKVKNKRASAKPKVNLTGSLWEDIDPRLGKALHDSHDVALRMMLEAPTTQGGYGIKVSDRDLHAAVDAAAWALPFHPVKRLVESFTWDGETRAERLFIDYLGCDDTPYYRATAMKFLIAAIARLYEPGHKFDSAPILEGVQGKGKSTFIETLAMGFFSELEGDLSDRKTMVEKMGGAWIMEMPELQGFRKIDVTILKGFMTTKVDKVRPAYGKRMVSYPRQVVFMGSTNEDEYLRDPTGARRFWPIRCSPNGAIDNKRLGQNVHQIWAEAYAMYRALRNKIPKGDLPLYLDDEEAAGEALLIQESRAQETSESVLAGQIESWLEIPMEDDFDDMDDKRPDVYRQETCVSQIWSEMLGRQGIIPPIETAKIAAALKMVGWNRSPQRRVGGGALKKYGRVRLYSRPV